MECFLQGVFSRRGAESGAESGAVSIGGAEGASGTHSGYISGADGEPDSSRGGALGEGGDCDLEELFLWGSAAPCALGVSAGGADEPGTETRLGAGLPYALSSGGGSSPIGILACVCHPGW